MESLSLGRIQRRRQRDQIKILTFDAANSRPCSLQSVQEALGTKFGQRGSTTQSNHRRHEQNPEGRPTRTGNMTVNKP